jgi:hypothetical protein
MNSLQRRKGRRLFRKLQHSILIDAKKHRDAGEWCLENFGKRWQAIDGTDGAWAMFWAGPKHHNKYIFHFVEEKDMMWFILKWA